MVTCCAFCGADLSFGPPTGVFGRIEERCPDCGLDADAETNVLVPSDEEMVYDFSDWEPRDRLALRAALVEGDVPFRWEPGPVLAVHENDVGLVEEILDRLDQLDDLGELVEAGGLDPDADGTGEADGGEAAQAMGDLFVVADRLTRGAWDAPLAAELAELEAVVGAASPPYGVEPRVWSEVARLAAELRSQVEAGAEDTDVAATAAALRDRLRPLV